MGNDLLAFQNDVFNNSQWWQFGAYFWRSREGTKDGDHRDISGCSILAVQKYLLLSANDLGIFQ